MFYEIHLSSLSSMWYFHFKYTFELFYVDFIVVLFLFCQISQILHSELYNLITYVFSRVRETCEKITEEEANSAGETVFFFVIRGKLWHVSHFCLMCHWCVDLSALRLSVPYIGYATKQSIKKIINGNVYCFPASNKANISNKVKFAKKIWALISNDSI